MAGQITTKKLAGNVVLSISAQIVSILVSLVIHLIVPKFVSELTYSHWQVYVLYIGYVGVFHFGLLDGLVLRYSQFDYQDLDKAKMRSQFQVLLAFTSVLAIIVAVCSLSFMGANTAEIFAFVGISIVTKNVFTYNSYAFQITNRIKEYVFLVLLQRVLYGIAVLLLVVLKIDDFRLYCLCDIVADVISFFVMSLFNKGMFIGKSLPLKETFVELKANVGAGIMLMLANWSAILLVGGAKMMIEWCWDDITFGKVSLAFSVTNLFLTFVSAISIVLFPSLKRIQQEKLVPVYQGIKGVMTPLLLLVMALYFPGCWLLSIWLPKYEISLSYLAYLLPMIVFSSKINLLTNNYMKMFRLEKLMLIINVVSVAVALIAFAIFAFWLKWLEAIFIALIVVIAGVCVISDVVVCKKLAIKVTLAPFVEVVGSIIFVLTATLLDRWIGFGVYFAITLVYALANVGKIKRLYKQKKEKS